MQLPYIVLSLGQLPFPISLSNKTAYSLSNNIPYDLLAEQIIEFKGKVLGQRVLDIECPTIETTLTQTGNVNGTQVNQVVLPL
ncbi:MAG: hypothetical protein ACJ72Q_13860 [Nitrososphaeraceae archaeon]